ncbi:hypothetical protein DFH09DRAFT_1077618 [Mycena vulgaris]|nr:hypothetical protein DFH09DRAFT_1077618 [Mycena vulgaris]
MAFGLRKKNLGDMRQVNSISPACEKVPTYFNPEPPLTRKDSLKSSFRAVFGSKLKKPDPADTSSASKEKLCTDAAPRKSQRPSLGARVLKTLRKAQVFFRCGGQRAEKLRNRRYISVDSQEKSWKPLKLMTSANTSLPANLTQAESASATENDQKDSSAVCSEKKSFSGRHVPSFYLLFPALTSTRLAARAARWCKHPLALITGVAYCVSWVCEKAAILMCCILALAVGPLALFADLLISIIKVPSRLGFGLGLWMKTEKCVAAAFMTGRGLIAVRRQMANSRGHI